MKLLVNILFFVSLQICLSRSFVLEKGCPDVKPVDNFNLAAFGKGVWHEMARYPNELQTSNCSRAEYVPQGDKIHFIVHSPPDIPEGVHAFVSGVSGADDSKGVLQYTVTYGEPKATIETRDYILAVDYNNYYISYECLYDEEAKVTLDYAWIGVRSKDVSNEVRKEIDNYLKSSKVLDANRFVWLDLHDKSC